MLHRYVAQDQASRSMAVRKDGNRTADESITKPCCAREPLRDTRCYSTEDRFGDRSKALVKNLGRHLRALGMTDPNLVANHSWRHRARTLMEAKGILPWTQDWFV